MLGMIIELEKMFSLVLWERYRIYIIYDTGILTYILTYNYKKLDIVYKGYSYYSRVLYNTFNEIFTGSILNIYIYTQQNILNIRI